MPICSNCGEYYSEKTCPSCGGRKRKPSRSDPNTTKIPSYKGLKAEYKSISDEVTEVLSGVEDAKIFANQFTEIIEPIRADLKAVMEEMNRLEELISSSEERLSVILDGNKKGTTKSPKKKVSPTTKTPPKKGKKPPRKKAPSKKLKKTVSSKKKKK